MNIEGVWVDDLRLYWTDFADLRACLKADCAHTTRTYPMHLDTGPGVAVSEGYAYWHTSNSIYSCPGEGCAPKPVLVTEDPSARDMFPHRDYVYWSSAVDIYRCPATGCAATPEVVARDSTTDQLVFGEARAYWPESGGIRSVPLDGSEPPKLEIQLAERPGEVAAAQGYLYWTTGKQAFRCPLASCNTAPPELLLTTDTEFCQLQVDDSAMFWLEGGAVRTCPLSGCEQPLALTPPQGIPECYFQQPSFAIDKSGVYWIQEGPPDANGGPGLYGRTIHKTAR